VKFPILFLTALLPLACSNDPDSGGGQAGSAGNTGTAGSGGGTAGSAGAAGSPAGGAAGSAGVSGNAGASGSGGTSGAGSGGTGGGGAGGTGGTGGGGDSCAGALVCEDFEAQTADSPPGAPWTVETNQQGQVVVMAGNAHSGTKALRVTTNGLDTYQRAYVSVSGSPLFPAAENMLWGRLMIYTEAAANDGVHWTNIQAEGELSPGVRAFIRYGGQHQQRLMANYYSEDGRDCWDHSDTAMPLGQWACMEWQYDGPNDTMRFYLNGVAVDDMTVMGTGEGCGGANVWDFPVFNKVLVGWESYQTDDPREVWIDDVALGTERLGCP